MKKLFVSYDNEPLSGLTHFIGFLLSIAGLTLLVVFASLHATPWHVVGFSIFGASLILLYLASTLYHFFPINTKAKKLLQKIDHAMIYVLIAGTYTPVCLVTLRGVWGWSLLGVIWGLATIGIVWKSVRSMHPVVSALFYVVMGWLAVAAFAPLHASLPVEGLWWLFGGGIFYTIGVIFFSLDSLVPRTKYFGMHEVWHLFVMAGSFSHFWLLWRFVL